MSIFPQVICENMDHLYIHVIDGFSNLINIKQIYYYILIVFHIIYIKTHISTNE